MLKQVSAFVALALLASVAMAQDQKTVEDQTHCPMMIKKEVNADSKTVEYKGIKIRMCCDTCVKRFEKYPEAYLDAKYIPQLNGMEIPARKISQRYCPVYPDRVITEKDPFVIYKERKVYLFNKAAVKKWNKNPEKYAKADLLPQLAEPIPEKTDEVVGESTGDSSDDEDEEEDENENDEKAADKKSSADDGGR